MQAAMLAFERGWSMNLGGGFHHCSSERGGGYCAYADVTLAVRLIMEHGPDVNKVMIVDLDASQVRHPTSATCLVSSGAALNTFAATDELARQLMFIVHR